MKRRAVEREGKRTRGGKRDSNCTARAPLGRPGELSRHPQPAGVVFAGARQTCFPCEWQLVGEPKVNALRHPVPKTSSPNSYRRMNTNVHQQGREPVAVARPCAGIDVSKAFLDAAWGDRLERVSNDAEGWDALVAKLQADAVDVVLLEASGGYEKAAACALQAAGFAVVVMNPRQARDFAKAMGELAKTDQVDARMLKQFAEVIARHRERDRYVRALPDEQRRHLAALVMRRRQLSEMRIAESNRLALAHPAARKSVQAMLKALDKQLGTVDDDIDQHLRRHFKEVLAWLDTIKGVGDVVQATVVGLLGELGQLPHRSIAKLVGVAPLADDSGERRGKRCTWGGRKEVRSVLYMATLSAIQHNTVIRTFHERLIAKGKPKKVAIVACMRKLLTIMNAMVRDRAPWDDSKHLKTA
jgi:transposase